MRLFELLNPRAATARNPLTVVPKDSDEVFGHTATINGLKYEFFYNDEGDGEYYMSFTGEDSRGRRTALLTNLNKPFAVFSAAMASIIQTIHETDANMIWFTVDSAESQRITTYDRMLDTAEKRGHFPEGYTWDRDSRDNYYIFKDGYR